MECVKWPRRTNSTAVEGEGSDHTSFQQPQQGRVSASPWMRTLSTACTYTEHTRSWSSLLLEILAAGSSLALALRGASASLRGTATGFRVRGGLDGRGRRKCTVDSQQILGDFATPLVSVLMRSPARRQSNVHPIAIQAQQHGEKGSNRHGVSPAVPGSCCCSSPRPSFAKPTYC